MFAFQVSTLLAPLCQALCIARTHSAKIRVALLPFSATGQLFGYFVCDVLLFLNAGCGRYQLQGYIDMEHSEIFTRAKDAIFLSNNELSSLV